MRRPRTSSNSAGRALAAAIGLAFLAGTAQAAEFQVEMNKSKALNFPKPVSTVMVGNPAVADVTVESANLVYVMGKSYGTTNLIALDADGKPMLDLNVNVVSQATSAVTLTRGAGQVSYNCTPRCERVPNIGDNPDGFDMLLKQTIGASGMGSGASAGGGGGTENPPQ